MKVEVNVLPDFQPNEYLFETHKDKGTERWEIYAWALRDAMMKAGNFEACDMSLRAKFAYENYMQKVRGAVLDMQKINELKIQCDSPINIGGIEEEDSPLP